MGHETHQSEQSDKAGFATTRWSIVIDAGRRSDAAAEAALAGLCEAYWSRKKVVRVCRSPKEAVASIVCLGSLG